MLLKLQEHQCKQCEKKLPTYFDLLLHVAKHHGDTQVEIGGDQDEAKLEKEQVDNLDKEEVNKRFVFSEFMLDEILYY